MFLDIAVPSGGTPPHASAMAPVCPHDGVVSGAVTGVQFVADFCGCRCAGTLLQQAGALEAACARAVGDSGLTVVATRFHQFEPGGATGVVLLAESHLAIHTWPENAFVSIDLYVCNFNADNTGKARDLLARLRQLFNPAFPAEQCIERGGVPAAAGKHG